MTTQDATRWIARLFQESEDALTPATPRDAVPAWDSLGELTLMADMDEKFGIVLTDNQLRVMAKVDDILDVLRNNGKITD
ncbi:MAG: acyl carrier protein [candidate division NC10 bacterium]|nr:acyl carrier protein [candidate division NC10 bacterium]